MLRLWRYCLPQVKYILGLTIARADKLQDYLELIFDNLWQFKWVQERVVLPLGARSWLLNSGRV